jgi:hypothetical protein
MGFRGRTHGSDAGNFSHHRQLAEERIDITNMSAFEILSAILDKLTGDKEKMDCFSSSVIERHRELLSALIYPKHLTT